MIIASTASFRSRSLIVCASLALALFSAAAPCAYGHQIEIDATALTPAILAVPTLGFSTLETNAPQSLVLNSGIHSLIYGTQAGQPTVSFTVQADGTVTYAPELEGILQGAGTSNLVVNGVAIELDCSQLSPTWASLIATGVFTGELPQVMNLRLLPGGHDFQYHTNVDQPHVYFTVNTNGTVSYAPELEGILEGSGTSNLVVNGAAIELDCSQLTSHILFATGVFLGEIPRVMDLRLLPGGHDFHYQTNAGQPRVIFTVHTDETVSYAPELEGILEGSGTSALLVNGVAVAIATGAISGSYDYVLHNVINGESCQVLGLLPGLHGFRLPDFSLVFDFEVTLAQTVEFDPSLDTAVAGRGTTMLQVRNPDGSFPSCNDPPIANAGSDQSVDEGTVVVLDGTASSDPDNDPLTYTWAQLAGPAVVLDTMDPVHPTFEAPTVPLGGSTLTFELIVNDGSVNSAADTVDITVKNVNHPPVADAGLDQTLAEASPVTLNGSGSYDVDGDALAYAWTQTSGTPVTLDLTDPIRPTFTAPLVGFSGETLAFELTVNDGQAGDSDSVNVLVENVNHDPTADAGDDQTRNEGTLVTLDGTGSSDPDGDTLTYAWQQVSGQTVTLSGANGPTPSFTAPQVGAAGDTLVFRLTVDDGYGGTDDDEVAVTVQDTNAPPACELAQPSVDQIWPPNHKMVAVSILGVTDPENNQVTITILNVTQDEPINGLGDGDTAPDAVIQGSTVLLRAERAGTRAVPGNGRVYRIAFEADDGIGGVCTGFVTVCVPHDQGQGSNCIDDGQNYNSLGP